jgi:hypothetical protein
MLVALKGAVFFAYVATLKPQELIAWFSSDRIKII